MLKELLRVVKSCEKNVSCKRVAEVVIVLKCKRSVVGFTAVAKKRRLRVLFLFGGDRVEKL